MKLKEGLTHKIKIKVSDEDNANNLGNPGVNVFATPAMLRLMEHTASEGVLPYLEEGQATVGISLDINHLAATPIGMEVEARAELIKVDGKKLTFKVVAEDEIEKVGEGIHMRYIIDLDEFENRTNDKLSKI
ncbi:thioesterase family protein [Halonatronum saccharophilum]|uniref:thioesterase family protein n=1 Tax=Halonatronum saccharophilum TaxID=150060 RepID=UPI0004865105|nr:thioesterase family protein [Halonatronum saccharophilum]